MVILDMQFLWLYVDDLMGKGLEWFIILELMLYASANWVPMALPLSVLLASIMTFGSLGEKNELIAMKAGGMSLFKIMRPLMLVVFFISVFAFYFTNSLWPVANFKMRVLLRDIQNTKVALALQPGVFFKSDLFSIRVGEKSQDGNQFKDILIYDHTNMGKQSLGAWSYKSDPRDYKRVIRAQSGQLINPDDKSKFQLKLENGYVVQEWNPKSLAESKVPFMRYFFENSTISFDLNSFEFQRTNEESYHKEQYLLNLNQIYLLNDSANEERKLRFSKIDILLKKSIPHLRDSIPIKSLDSISSYNSKAFELVTSKQNKSGQKKDYELAIKKIDQIINHVKIVKSKEKSSSNYKNDLEIELNRKFTLSYAVFMLFFLGAPLGAIVKKGGLGWPVITAILIFLVYFILTRAGEEMAESYTILPTTGMWLSAICITPLSIFIFYKANKDSKLFDMELYNKFFSKLFKSNK
jgi:lipopolysaccharide export system permease protein